MQGGFRGGDWGKIFGLPGVPYPYVVGCTDLVAGATILGYSLGVVPAYAAQWAATIAAFITLNATSAHVVRGDPPHAVQFCCTMCVLYTVLTFVIAAQRQTKGKVA